jgi:hypothetical protein
MNEYPPERKERNFALVGFLVSLLIAVYTTIVGAPSPVMYAITMAFGFYMVASRKFNYPIHYHLETVNGRTLFWILLLLFIWAAFLTILSAFSTVYAPPVAYYVGMATMASLVAVQIITYPQVKSRGTVYIAICEIAVISLFLRFIQFFKYPYFVGIDPWLHAVFINDAVGAGHVDPLYSYANFPTFPMANIGVMLFTGVGDKLAFAITSGIPETLIAPICVYLIGKKLFNERVALMAMILFSTATYSICWGNWVIPMSLGIVFFLASVYLLFVHSEEKKFGLCMNIVAAIIFMGLILLHTVSAFIFLVALVVAYISKIIYDVIYQEKRFLKVADQYTLQERMNAVASLPILVFYGAALILWWWYSGFLRNAINLINRAFIRSSSVQIHTYTPYIMNILGTLGLSLLMALTIIGILRVTNNRLNNKYRFSLAAVSIGIIAIPFLSRFGVFKSVLPYRWMVFAEATCSIFAAFALLGTIVKEFRKSSAAIMAVLVFVIVFLSTTATNAYDGSSIYSQGENRVALIDSEVAALIDLNNNHETRVYSDLNYMDFAVYSWYEDLYPWLKGGEAKSETAMVFLREYIKENQNPYVLSYEEVIDLNGYGLEKGLYDLGLSSIYDSGTIDVYYYKK